MSNKRLPIWIGFVIVSLLLAVCVAPAASPTPTPEALIPPTTDAPTGPGPAMPPVSGDLAYTRVEIAEAGLSIEIPAGWLRLEPDWVWTPAADSALRLGIQWADLQPAQEVEAAMLPTSAVILSSEPVTADWGEGRWVTVAVYGAGDQIQSVEAHILFVVTQNGARRALDLVAIAPDEAQLAAQQPLLQRLLTTARLSAGDIFLNLAGVAQDQMVETIAAVPPSAAGPYWSFAPQYRRVTLREYPVTDHLFQPQIFIYPAADFVGFNETAAQMIADLQTQLRERQPIERMPYLPLYNAAQVMHAQVQYLDFQNGAGVRYLTQFDQAPLPINNYELLYTFQGLTHDGKYYIAAVLPVTHPELPVTQLVSAQQADELSDFPAYLTRTLAWLEQQPANSFTPDLTKLDVLIQSIEVK